VVSGNLTTDGLVDGRDVATDGAKLDGIESGATADQTAAEIKTAYESNADTNAFTDADESKLDGIEASADVTDTANVTAAGALMDSELTSEASVKALNQGVATTDSPTFAGVTAPITGNVTGNLTGNVTGNVTGNLTGDVTGDVTGDLTGSVLTAAQTNITSVGTLGSLTVSGDVTVDTNTLKVDSTNNRVGILNSSPDVSLDVGSATDAMHVPVGTTAQRPTGAAGYFRYNSTTGGFEGYTDAWGAIAGGGGGVAPSIDTMTGDGSDTTLALTNAPVNENATFVTIDGVAQHKSTYSVSGTTLTFSTAPPTGSAVEAITLNTTTINTASILQDADGDTKVQVEESSDEDKIRFDTAGTERAVIDSSGLDVTGTVTADGGTIVSTGSDAFSSKAVGGYAVQAYQDATSSGHTALDLRSDATTDTRYLIRGYNDAAGTPTEVFSVGADGSAFLNSNVGIGTSSPTRALSVFGDTAGVISITSNSTDGISSLSFGDTADDNAGRVNYLNASDAMLFYTATAERMRIDSSGNVGIGSSPASALSIYRASGVNAYIEVAGNNNTPGSTSMLFGQDGSNYGYCWNRGNQAVLFGTNGTERMRIDSSGNLGLGTSSTAAKLHINEAANKSEGDAHFRIQGAGYSGFHWLDATAYYIGQNSSSRNLRLYSGAETAGVNLSNGGTSWGTFSDERLKYDIEPVENALESLSELRTVKYRLKNVDEPDSQKKIGVVAQDLVGVLDEVIDPLQISGDDTEYMAVRYTELVPVLIKAIQEQQETIAALEARITQLENN